MSTGHKDLQPPATSIFKRIINDSRSLGILLLLCTFFSLILTNIEGIGNLYYNFWEMSIPGFHDLHLPHTIIHFVNDALMTLFFFHVAIDIKREVTKGELSSFSRMMLPTASALFGVAFPAVIFSVITAGTAYSNGWAIPTATDIAFTLGMISLLGKAVPHSMKVFLTALAIIDDLCAILIIALFYGSALYLIWLVGVVVVALAIFLINRHFQHKSVYYITVGLGLVMWYCMYRSGIHASFAGVILAFIIPVSKMPAFEKRLGLPVNFIIVPIFALANTSILISPTAISGLTSPLSLGIILGLFLGKPIGITLAVYLMVKLRLVRLANIHWVQFIGVGILAGIGFTMSIFVSNLSFPDDKMLKDIAKLSVLIASALAMIVGYIWLKAFSREKEEVDT
ncbi:pH-dependent sodium/proton antiporter [Proteiniphilum saccharofermentans]|uniref:Na(+)/H(+) antiporter NhaA n=1 Tax=Proteiniphilum saccharofermentans TaxID=1642647 RepID=A0A1R3SZ23_9BACT|nr:Na+/H+ antiporter NhaA [Proteiniphilum saccharofermentans]SCD21436.1 pH-dependent sodium/proton antiporter [Proteiniphilum saccharofermentans]